MLKAPEPPNNLNSVKHTQTHHQGWPEKLRVCKTLYQIFDLRALAQGQQSCRSARTFRTCFLDACACSGLKGSQHTQRVAFPGEIALIEIFCLIAW